MPTSVIAAVAGALAGIGVNAVIAGIVANVGFSMVASAVIGAVFRKDPAPAASTGNSGWTSQMRDRLHIVRVSDQPRNVIYGECMTSGPMVFAGTTGADNSVLHMAIILAGHECQEIGDIYLGEKKLGTLSGSFVAGSAAVSPTMTHNGGGFLSFDVTPGSAAIPDTYVGTCIAGEFANLVTVSKHLGSAGQVADADLVAAAIGWTDACTLTNCAYLYAQLRYDATVFAAGIPNIKAVVKGRKIYDSRSATTVWTDNWALCVRDYIYSAHGLNTQANISFDEINGTSFEAAANVSDEYVDISTETSTVTRGSDGIFFAAPATAQLSAGTRVKFTTSGTLPAPLAENTFYFVTDPTVSSNDVCYLQSTLALALAGTGMSLTTDGAGTHKAHIFHGQGVTLSSNVFELAAVTENAYGFNSPSLDIRTGDGVIIDIGGASFVSGMTAGYIYYAIRVDATHIKIANSLAHALAGTAMSITITGATYLTISRVTQRRYTCNGSFTLDKSPRDILSGMLTAGIGQITHTQGQYALTPGAFTSTVMTLTADDLRGPLDVQTRIERRNLFNAVRGTYANPVNLWQPSDFPAVSNSAYATQDGGEVIWHDISLPYTTDAMTAQRIAKAYIEESRQGIVVNFPAKYTAFKLQVGDTVGMTISQLGWSDKAFLVVSWALAAGGGIDLILRETSSAIWDWAYGDETYIDPAPDSTLPSAFTCSPPTDLVADAGTHFTTQGVGLAWLAGDLFATDYVVQYKDAAGSQWITLPTVRDTFTRVDNLKAGDYKFRVKAVNHYRIESAPTSELAVSVVEETIENVSGLTTFPVGPAQFVGKHAKFTWDHVGAGTGYWTFSGASADYSGPAWWRDYQVQIYVGESLMRTDYVRDNLYDYTLEMNAEDSGGTPVRSFTIKVKARSVMGQLSATAASLTVTNDAPAVMS